MNSKYEYTNPNTLDIWVDRLEGEHKESGRTIRRVQIERKEE